jgi:hypothetical protein
VADYNLLLVLLVVFLFFRGWGVLGNNLVTLGTTNVCIYLHQFIINKE